MKRFPPSLTALVFGLALLILIPVTTAQAPGGVPMTFGGVDYICHVVDLTEAPHEATPTPGRTPPATLQHTPRPKPTQTPTSPIPICRGVVSVGADYNLRLRKVPSLSGGVIGSVPNGAVIDAVEVSDDGRWFRIEEPLPGWIAAEWVVCEG